MNSSTHVFEVARRHDEVKVFSAGIGTETNIFCHAPTSLEDSRVLRADDRTSRRAWQVDLRSIEHMGARDVMMPTLVTRFGLDPQHNSGHIRLKCGDVATSLRIVDQFLN